MEPAGLLKTDQVSLTLVVLLALQPRLQRFQLICIPKLWAPVYSWLCSLLPSPLKDLEEQIEALLYWGLYLWLLGGKIAIYLLLALQCIARDPDRELRRVLTNAPILSCSFSPLQI